MQFQRYYFPFMERTVIQSSHPRALKSIVFYCILTFFRILCLKSEHKVSFFIFGLEGHKNLLCILSISLRNSVWTFDISERKTIFEMAMILHSIVKRRIRQTFMIWFQTWILWKCSKCINKFLKRSFVS